MIFLLTEDLNSILKMKKLRPREAQCNVQGPRFLEIQCPDSQSNITKGGGRWGPSIQNINLMLISEGNECKSVIYNMIDLLGTRLMISTAKQQLVETFLCAKQWVRCFTFTPFISEQAFEVLLFLLHFPMKNLTEAQRFTQGHTACTPRKRSQCSTVKSTN